MDRDWYLDHPETECDTATESDGTSCDEYPYFASAQSGPADVNGIKTTAAEWIDADANEFEGFQLYNNRFLQPCGVVPGEAFLVVPVIDLGMKTDSKC